MDKLRYQNDYLKAMNQKLKGSEDMYRLACETSDNAFLYYSFVTKEVKCLGRFQSFFDFEVKEPQDMHMLYECMHESYVDSVRNLLFLENKKQSDETCLCMQTPLNLEGISTFNAQTQFAPRARAQRA